LRDQLLRDVGTLSSAEGAAIWAHRILAAKNTLHEADARQVEEAFQAKLTTINGQLNSASGSDRHDEPQAQSTHGYVAPATSATTGHALEAIDKSELAHPEPRRIRDKDHLRFVATQSCLICGRIPAVPIICALRKAAHLGERSATSGLSHSVEGIIARFTARVTSATGGEKPALTRTLPREAYGYRVIPRVRSNAIV
jgi:hypothetical protein